jgi:RNA polymerase sigma-70 factor (ECF subfamily)
MGHSVCSSLAEAEEAAGPPPLFECIGGDGAAWRALHRQYYPIAVAFLRKLGVNEGDLEDACQEVFLQMFRYLPRFRGEADPKTWLYRLCITQARRARLKRRLGYALEKVLAWAPKETLLSSPGFCEQAARQRIEKALAQMTASDRSVFVLYEMEGVSGKQIAEIVGCKEATLWRRLHYARQSFRAALEQTEQPA